MEGCESSSVVVSKARRLAKTWGGPPEAKSPGYRRAAANNSRHIKRQKAAPNIRGGLILSV
jgi:hypothetical protein